MQIVSKWHNTGRNVASGSDRVERISPIVSESDRHRDRRNGKQAASVSSLQKDRMLDGHTIIAAQVIASRLSDAHFDIDADSNRIAGNISYGLGLDRKVHRMEAGSFYQDAA